MYTPIVCSADPTTNTYQVTISWDKNTETDLDGYKVYYGVSSGNYVSYDYVRKDETVYTLSNLTSGVTYYIAVTAYDFSENESTFSSEVTTADDDIDGIPDSWEIANFGNLTTVNEATDYDNDDLLDIDEYANGTDPKDDDSDSDGIKDGDEVAHGTDPGIVTPTATSIVSNTGTNDGVVNITDLVGTNFQNPATVKLTMSGESDIVASNVVVNANTTQITCAIDLDGAVQGAWDVEVSIPNGETGILQSGVTVIAVPVGGGLLGDWKLDDGSGSWAADSSGKGYIGTVNGGAAWNTVGAIGGALDFDGTDDYVDVGDIDLTDSFTIAAWVRLSGAGKSMVVGKTYQSYQLFVAETGVLIFQRNSSTPINYNAGLMVGKWHHVAVTFNTTAGMVMYLDGSAVATDGNITPTNTNNVATKIGATGLTAMHFFNGTLDDVRVRDTALTALEVFDLFNN